MIAEPAISDKHKKTMKEHAKAVATPDDLVPLVRTCAAKKTRDHKDTYKLGVEGPKKGKKALKSDAYNGTTFWSNAIAREMKKVEVAFDNQPERASKPVGRKIIK